jgi:seryl-tRNA synthetase
VIDIRRLRREPAVVKAAWARRGIETGQVDQLLELDGTTRRITGARDEVRARVKELSRQVGDLRRSGDGAKAEAVQAESRALGAEAQRLEAELEAVAGQLRQLLLVLPNLPSPQAPDGAGPQDNPVVRHWSGPVLPLGPDGTPRPEEHQRVAHWDIGVQLGILDLERGAKLSGSMFPLFRGAGAKLLRALTAFALDRHSDAFEEVRPPTLVRSETLESTGQLPKFADDAYHVERDDLWAIPTAEVPLTSMFRDEILAQEDLPLRLTAATACYRRESGSAGRDTRGVLRVHEFDKVEILAFCTPEQAVEVHADLLRRAEDLLQALELSYRVVDLCAGDLGQSSARTFDLEVYAPGAEQWLEVSSVSWFGDYQARRANVRYRGTDGPALVHTLNGSALAWSRIWAAILETRRQPDGTVVVPPVLRPYLGGLDRIGPSA